MNIPRGRQANPSPPVQVNSSQPRGAQPTPPPQSGIVYQQGRPDASYGGYPTAQVNYRHVPPSTSPHDMNKQQMQQSMGPAPNQPPMGQQMYIPQQTNMRPAFYNSNPRQQISAQRHQRPMNISSQPPQQYQPQIQTMWNPAANQGYMQTQQPYIQVYPAQQQMTSAQTQYINQSNSYRTTVPSTPPYYSNTQPNQIFFQPQMQHMQTTNTGRQHSQPPYVPPQQQAQQPVKRERKPLSIVDPTTGKSINEDLSTINSKSGTPPLSDSERSTPNNEPKKEIQAQFAAQVIETIIPKSSSDAVETAPAAEAAQPDTTELPTQPLANATEPVANDMDSNSGQPPSAPTEIPINVIEATPPHASKPEDVGETITEVAPKIDSSEPEPVIEAPSDSADAAAGEVEAPVEKVEPVHVEEQTVEVKESTPPVAAAPAAPVSESVQSSQADAVDGTTPSAPVTESVVKENAEVVKEPEVAKENEVPTKPSEPEPVPVPNGKKPVESNAIPSATETNAVEEAPEAPKEPAPEAPKEPAPKEPAPKEPAPKEPAPEQKDKRLTIDVTKAADKALADNTNQVASRKDKEDLKYKYREEPWSPVDPEGKKSYDRDFLLDLQFAAKSLEKPDGLPQLSDVILDKPITSRSEASRGGAPKGAVVDFTPGYVRSPRGSMGGGRRSGQRDRGPKPQKVISLTLEKKEDIVLHHSDSAWKPTVQKNEKVDDQDNSQTEDLYKKVRSILNKLTPQKFQTLVTQVLDLTIDTEERLTGVINLVFEKAIDEPSFSVAYANMCKYLMQVKVPSKNNPNEMIGFRKLLLSRCQREFEKDASDAIDHEKRQKTIDEAQEEDKKKLLQAELRLEIAKAKRRTIGNIRFIGELFKLKMLTEAIMHDCLLKLLKSSSDEDNLECLCRLLNTIGKDIDHEKAKPRVDQYFQQMNKIVAQKKTSSRVRFMLQDVMDLRMSNWVPRRADNNPKTIAQIHQEAAKEAQDKALLAAQPLEKPPRGKGKPERGGRDETGWSTVSATKASRIDPSKMKISKTNMDENFQLGPGGRPGAFGAWGRGSSGGGKQQSQESERPSTPGNRYAALGGSAAPDADRSRTRGMPPSGRESPRPRGAPTQGSRGSLPSRPSRENRDRQAALDAARNFGRGSGSRDSSREPAPKPSPATPPPEKQTEMSEDLLTKKAKSIIDEFLHINDLKEAILCVQELGKPSNMHVFVTECINNVLERSQKAREKTGELLHDIVKQGHVTVEQYIQGLKEVIEFAEDMEIDIPKIWVYLSELIGPMVQDSLCVPLSFLKDVCTPLVANNKAGKLIASILHNASQRLGHLKVGELWNQNKMLWSDFLPSSVNATEFIKEQNVEFTIKVAELSPRSTISMESIKQQLGTLIIKENKRNEDVFDWIEAFVAQSRAKEPEFIRALMTSVCSSAIHGEGPQSKADPKVLNFRSALLQRYLDHQAELELQALYALQALVHKLEHPAGLLRMFFDTLYDEDIISEDAFKQWECSKDTSEQEGKGIAVKSVVQFFTWLSEADPEPDGNMASS